MYCLMIRLSLFLVFSLTAGWGADWPHWRGPNFDGKTVEKLGEVTSLHELWTTEVGIGFSSFSVVGERVYTMGFLDEKEIVWCLDARTGATLWKHAYAADVHAK